MAALALGEAALSPLHADTYQFIVSGYPAANESYSAASSGMALATATRSGGSTYPIEQSGRGCLRSNDLSASPRLRVRQFLRSADARECIPPLFCNFSQIRALLESDGKKVYTYHVFCRSITSSAGKRGE